MSFNFFDRIFKIIFEKKPQSDHPSCQFKTDKTWLELQFHNDGSIKRPHEIESDIEDPPDSSDETILDRIQGSLLGLALGDALGAHVEFRPHEYLLANPVEDLQGDGTWKLEKGQFTDDTSMALCLAASLIAHCDFVPYDQLVRYKWWYSHGYMSSIGRCFDIEPCTKESLNKFIQLQNKFVKKHKIPDDKVDYLSDDRLLQDFNVYCSQPDAADNGALMRLAPVPLFFYQNPEKAIEFSGRSGQITHGDIKAYDACRYYAALIIAALKGYTKDQLLDDNFYRTHIVWFSGKPFCNDIRMIAEGSYKKRGGYDEGIRGKSYIVKALEAALWAFCYDDDSFEKGVLAAVNLGDDTDTTAAIYGQLAGAYYGYENLPKKWVDEIYGKKFILQFSKWIEYEGKNWKKAEINLLANQCLNDSIHLNFNDGLMFNEIQQHLYKMSDDKALVKNLTDGISYIRRDKR